MAENLIEIDKDDKVLEINERIRFSLNDELMQQLFKFLSSSGRVLLDCPRCSLTLIPQAKAAYAANGRNDQKVSCVGCGRTVNIRIYPTHAFILED